MQHSLKDQLSIEVKSLFYGYPKFVYSKNDIKNLDGIPVFVYHTIDPDLFEAHLKYLKSNKYKTLTIQEFHETITESKNNLISKSVLLTIDDARSSVWRYAYPLLKKYNMNATVFVIPGVTEEGSSKRINLDGYWNSKYSLLEINDEDTDDNTLCNWLEIKEMYDSGHVDIESHTLFHKEVFCSTKVVDYITQDTPFFPYNFIGSPYFLFENIGIPFEVSKFIGLPLFESAPIMFAGPKLNVTSEFIDICKEIYQMAEKNNGEWKEKTNNFIKENSSNDRYFIINQNSEKDTLEDLRIARREIQNRLGKDAGNHLCLPWTKGNSKTIEVCKELDIKSIFWGVLENKKINKPGEDPYLISRIKNDFILRLPGDGRENLFSIYKYKIKRRLSGEKVF